MLKLLLLEGHLGRGKVQQIGCGASWNIFCCPEIIKELSSKRTVEINFFRINQPMLGLPIHHITIAIRMQTFQISSIHCFGLP